MPDIEPIAGSAATGIEGLDNVLAGGFARNRVYLIEGDPGTGKTTTSIQFLMEGARAGERGLYITLSETIAEMHEAATSHGWSLDGIDLFELVPPETFVVDAMNRGEKAAVMVFDEELGLLFRRTKALGFDLQAYIARGDLFIEQVDAAEQSPGEFAHRVRYLVEEHGVQTVVIDSLNGYQTAMPQEQFLVLHMHELLQFLNRRGATTFLTVAQLGVIGEMKAPIDTTYLADTVIMLRFFEALGSVRRAIAVIKKRAGAHEKTIREYQIDERGLTVGDVLDGFQGILRGVPDYVGGNETLMKAP